MHFVSVPLKLLMDVITIYDEMCHLWWQIPLALSFCFTARPPRKRAML